MELLFITVFTAEYALRLWSCAASDRPRSPLLGRLTASMIAIEGVGFIALPTGILGSAFVEELGHRRDRANGRCPTCGNRFKPGESQAE